MNDRGEVVLDLDDLREVAAYAAENAQDVLDIFEGARPTDARPREAVEAARAFARGGPRTRALRDAAWAAHRAARGDLAPGARDAALAAMHAAAAAYLHPLPDGRQVGHILGAAAHAARASELAAGDDREVGARQVERAARRATPRLAEVLRRFPAATPGGGRAGELLRVLDATLRS